MSTKKTTVKSKVNSEDSEYLFRPIHYLGSKLRILDFIQETINEIDPAKGIVCDLFSGSGSVSFMLSRTRQVISVDVQEYSRVICSALLKSSKIDQKFIDNFIKNCLNSKHKQNLNWALTPLIKHENLSIDNAAKNLDLEGLCDLLENGSIIAFELSKGPKKNTRLSKLITKSLLQLKSKNISNKQSLAVRYFGGIYFSYEQAIILDSILEEIEKSPAMFQEKLLAALLSTASECVNTVGKQFAQPIRPRKSNGQIKSSLGKMVQKDRSLNLLEIFIKWLEKYNSIPPRPYKNDFLKMDFKDALNNLPKSTKVVYADPPYTRDHYSRYYHVLETLALRDIPKISTMVLKGETLLSRGLYRENRHQSPFCIKSLAPKSFETLFSKVSSIKAKLVLSYSPYDESKNVHPRVITIKQLTDIAKKHFSSVKVISVGNFTHSKLNKSSQHLEASSVAEVLIVCT